MLSTPEISMITEGKRLSSCAWSHFNKNSLDYLYELHTLVERRREVVKKKKECLRGLWPRSSSDEYSGEHRGKRWVFLLSSWWPFPVKMEWTLSRVAWPNLMEYTGVNPNFLSHTLNPFDLFWSMYRDGRRDYLRNLGFNLRENPF